MLAALAGRKVVRSFTIQNDSDLAVVLAEAGEGVCWDEEDEVLHPLGFDSEDGDEGDDGGDAPGPARDPEDARRRASAIVWMSMNPRPAATCGPIVAAAASGDPRAVAVLRGELCELVFEAAKRRPVGLADLIRVLEVHGYYPAARRPELAALAKEANVDVSFLVAQARKDAAERRKWFQIEEPLD
ncbi:MAG: hypothetical protein JST00_32830 [Deltaproteobacteria bacterium]|nr:hypothetical protein [Deltaproteobacteria bacterium]